MSIFRREYRNFYGSPTVNPFDNPSLPLASVGFDSVYGLLNHSGNAAGEPVTVDRALALPTVWRCIGLLATVIASCPLKIYKNPGKKEVRVPALDAGNFQTTYTPYELWELIVAHLGLWGNAYVRKIRNGADAISDLRPINPALVTPKVDRDGHKIFEVLRVNEDGSIDRQHEPIIYTTFEVMHIPGLGYDGLRGLSPLQVAAQTYGTAMAADKLAARFMANGTHLSGIIKVKAPLADQNQADAIKQRWLATNAGTGSAGGVAVLDAETDFESLTIPPESMQFLESREWQASEIAKMYGVPPHLIGDTSKATSWGTGIEQQNIGFVAYTVASWTERIAQRVTREVVATRGQYASYDLTELMRGSAQERFAAYALGIQWGWLTRNEARVKEDMEPIDGLDEPLTPLNMIPNDDIDEYLQAAAAPPTSGPGHLTPPGSADNKQ